MVKYIHFSAVGTSLLRNAKNDNDVKPLLEKLGLTSWDTLSFDAPQQKIIVNNKSTLLASLIQYINKAGIKASAEIQSIEMALQKYQHKPDDTLIFLYSTDTENAKLAGDAIRQYFNNKGYQTQLAVVSSINREEDFDKGLNDLFDKVISKMKDWKDKGVEIYVNVSPGFKAESIFLAVSAFIIGGKVYYRYETFGDIVEISYPPLEIKKELMELISRHGYIIKEDKLTEEEKKYLSELSVFIKEKDKNVYELREWVKKMITSFYKLQKE